ncbi:MAG: hypothetical protein K8S21_05415 [Gemmatimonadetes bacterium]|nr:hypothetical protein [Gemmatimonadota bacterium]
MKRIAFVASLFVFAACAPKAEEKPATETAAPAADMMMDTTKKDTTKADTSAMTAPKADTTGMKKM